MRLRSASQARLRVPLMGKSFKLAATSLIIWSISWIADPLLSATHEKPARAATPATATSHGLDSNIPRTKKTPHVQRSAFATGAKCQETLKRARRFDPPWFSTTTSMGMRDHRCSSMARSQGFQPESCSVGYPLSRNCWIRDWRMASFSIPSSVQYESITRRLQVPHGKRWKKPGQRVARGCCCQTRLTRAQPRASG